MAPRADDHDQENLSDDDDDEGLMEDMAALSKACTIAATTTTTATTFSDNSYDDDHFTPPTADVLGLADEDKTRADYDTRDPLLDPCQAIVPFTAEDDDSDDGEDDLEYLRRVESLYKPLSTIHPPPPPPTVGTMAAIADDDDDEDDVETLNAILKRLSSYGKDPHESSLGILGTEEGHTSSLGFERDDSTSCRLDGSELCHFSQDPNNNTDLSTMNIEMQHHAFDENYKPDSCNISKLPKKRSDFPPSAQALVDTIKKNRSLQRFLRSKLIEIEAKIEENKQLRDKVKLLKDFQASCIRRTGSALSLKKDPCVQLISAKKSHSKKKSPMCYGPDENSHVANYKMVLERFPVSLDRKKWPNEERENLTKGIKQQFQEMVLQISLDRMSSECAFGDATDMDSIIASINNLEITPERIREFLPKVNWDQLASMYVPGRTGAECESRWLNCEDPLIYRGPWTGEEDSSLLLIVQDMGIRNWFNIAVSLGTNRTPFQCLARFQRSLNPSMLNSEWTGEEDAQLCYAVALFGESNWQAVASVLERRTGTQCSNRWKKSICPTRKGSFTPEEDKRLIVAVMLFGRKWNQIAKYVPGRIQSQCRDRYLNSLDPSLKWGGWTEEEDKRLEAAIVKHGFCWSKVAEDMPPRTDSQCRKRWKVLFPDQVRLLQEARKKQKSLVAGNFVDRESERPAFTLNDFLPLPTLGPPSDAGDVSQPRKRKRKSSNTPKETKPKGRSKKSRIHPKEEQDNEYSNEAKHSGRDVPFIAWRNFPKGMRSKRQPRKAPICLKYSEDTGHGDEVKTCSGDDQPELQEKLSDVAGGCFHLTVSKKETNNCGKLSRDTQSVKLSKNKNKLKTKLSKPGCKTTLVEGLESQDGDNITLASFVQKSKKKTSKASISSMTTVASKQVDTQNSSADQDELSQLRITGATENLVVDQNAAPDGRVIQSESATTLTCDDDVDNNMTLASLMGNKSKKWSKAATKLKTGFVLVPEVRSTNKQAIEADCNRPSTSKLVEEQSGSHGSASEDLSFNVDEENKPLACLVKRKAKKQGIEQKEANIMQVKINVGD